jgi:hypothetical protein
VPTGRIGPLLFKPKCCAAVARQSTGLHWILQRTSPVLLGEELVSSVAQHWNLHLLEQLLMMTNV